MSAQSCTRVWLAVALIAVCIGPARAENGSDYWYLLASYHQIGLDNANNQYSQPSGEIDFDSSFGDDTGPGLAVGYAFSGPYRVDVAYQSHSNDLQVSGNPFVSSSLDVTTVVASVWRDFGPWHGLRPYVGVGIGGGTLKLEDLDGDFYLGQFGVGVEWYFASRAALDIAYLYQLGGSNPELKGNSQTFKTEYTAQSLQIGFRFDVW